MQSKDGTRRSNYKAPEPEVDTKNRISVAIYESASEGEFESVYETDSDRDSNVTEEPLPLPKVKSLGHSPLAPTSESSFKLRTSDVISSLTSQHSDITDELILPASSQTQSPAVQVMDRNGGFGHCRSPGSSFSSASSSSAGSSGSEDDSLFSLKINSYSFTDSGELSKQEELQRQKRREGRGTNISIGETIPRKNVDANEESSSVQVSEGLSRANHHDTSHQNDFVLPLNFPMAKEKSINENKKKKKKKKKKGEHSTCSSQLCSWPSCSLNFLSCSGCNCLSCSGCKCSSFSCCCNNPKSSYSCNCKSLNPCKSKSSICC